MAGDGCKGMPHAAKVLEQYLVGEVQEDNGLQQLLVLHRREPKSVVAALAARTNAVVANAEAGLPATRAGALIVSAAAFLDGNGRPAAGEDSEALVPLSASASGLSAGGVSRTLLDHVLLLTGGPGRAAKEKTVRAQGCALVAALAPCAPGHRGAEQKLLEYAMDRLPSIREKAVRGLAAFGGSESAIVARTHDPDAAVRVAAVRSLRVNSHTVPVLLERLGDIESCVRVQLFQRLAEQPETVEAFDPTALVRTLSGLADPSPAVRAAAGLTADAWATRLGGSLSLLARCDVLTDEQLGETVAGELALRFPIESAGVVSVWLGAGRVEAPSCVDLSCMRRAPAPATLLARLALVAMAQGDIDDAVDAPKLLQHTFEMLKCSARKDTSGRRSNFILRQLLCVAMVIDVCDEDLRRGFEKLALAVMQHAPLLSTKEASFGQSLSCVDFAMLLLRKCCGASLALGNREHGQESQIAELKCNARAICLISELCETPQNVSADAAAGGFACRLSLRLQDLDDKIDEVNTAKKALNRHRRDPKKKDEIARNARELGDLQSERSAVRAERDTICLRVLAILTAVLRWTQTDLQRDPALLGSFEGVLQPMILLPALTEAIEVSSLRAIGLFCTRSPAIARGHWRLFTQLLSKLGQEPETQEGLHSKDRACAAVAAHTLADCSRLYRHSSALDSADIISAGAALSVVPFAERSTVLEPLCGWLLGCGDVFFDAYVKEPVLEVQWALGWLLAEAFTQRVGCEVEIETGHADEVDDSSEQFAGVTSRIGQLFALLSKLPGRHGPPMISLAVESIAESGLWRRAALLPQSCSDGKTRWSRHFSWPALFSFAHARLPAELRFRIWRCALQICVSNPSLALYAEVPTALVAVAGDAPAGALDLLESAVQMGADESALAPLRPMLSTIENCTGLTKLMVTQQEAEASEHLRRAGLAELGVDVEGWAPSSVDIPNVMPLHLRKFTAAAAPQQRSVTSRAKCGGGAVVPWAKSESLLPLPPPEPILGPQLPIAQGAKRRAGQRAPARVTAMPPSAALFEDLLPLPPSACMPGVEGKSSVKLEQGMGRKRRIASPALPGNR